MMSNRDNLPRKIYHSEKFSNYLFLTLLFSQSDWELGRLNQSENRIWKPSLLDASWQQRNNLILNRMGIRHCRRHHFHIFCHQCQFLHHSSIFCMSQPIKWKCLLLVRFEPRISKSWNTNLVIFKHLDNIIIIIAIGISSFFTIAAGKTVLVNNVRWRCLLTDT